MWQLVELVYKYDLIDWSVSDFWVKVKWFTSPRNIDGIYSIETVKISPVLELLKNSYRGGVPKAVESMQGCKRAIYGVWRGPFSIPLCDEAVPLSSKILDFWSPKDVLL